MSSLAQKLSGIVGDAFEAQGLDRAFGRVTVSDRGDLAQFQCNGAMPASKQAGKNPREIASAIVAKLLEKPVFAKADIAGPGFINLIVTDEFLSDHLKESAAEPKQGVSDIGRGDTVVLDYGGPNIAKAMHVGHLRAAIIGESVWRIMDFCGYKALGDIHLGDWGTHMGMLIGDYIATKEEHLVTNCDLANDAQVEALINDMAERYPRAATAAKENPELMERARVITVQLQNKEEPYYSIWSKIRAVC